MAPSPTPGVDRNQSSTLTTVTHTSFKMVGSWSSRHRRRNGNNTACVCAAFKLHGTFGGDAWNQEMGDGKTPRHRPLKTPRHNWPVSQWQALGPPEDPALSGREGPPHRALKLWCIQCVLLYQVISRPSSHITSIGISLAVNKGFKAGQSLAWRPVQVLQEDMSIHQHCYSGSSLPPLHLDFNPDLAFLETAA